MSRNSLEFTSPGRGEKQGGIWETVKTVLWALVIAGLFRTFLYQPFWIPSGSMKPTLLVGDYLYINKFAYGYSRYSCPFAMCPFEGRIWAGEPERGDVVVFRHPVTNQDYIKRLIGLPGDRVQMREGRLYINDQEAPQQLLDTPFVETKAPQGPQQRIPSCQNEPVSLGADCVKERSTEELPEGVVHDVLSTRVTSGDNTPVYEVPQGHYFFMGDNRDHSVDSRFNQLAGGVGMLPAEYLIGRAERILFSSAGAQIFYFWTWRSDRFFKPIL